VLGRHADGIR